MKTLNIHLSDEGPEVQRMLTQLVEWKNQARTQAFWLQRKGLENDSQSSHSLRAHCVLGTG